MNLSSTISALRPTHWVKNGFVFLPLFFGLQFLDVHLLKNCGIAFVCFSLMASAIYIFNDLNDYNYDIYHPAKKLRPIAIGTLSKQVAVYLSLLLVLLSLVISLMFDSKLTIVLVVYLLINIAYSLVLKKIVIVDVVCIATGFILRLEAGAVVSDIELSSWIIGITFLLSMFLALGKRRNDVVAFASTGNVYRKAATIYSLKLIDRLIVLIVLILVIGYISYTLSPSIIRQMHSSWLFTTSIWVIIGLGRYLYLIFRTQKSGSPTNILWTDLWLQLTLVAWMLNFFLLIY